LQLKIELVLIVYVLNEVATISPIFIYPNDVPIVREVTVNDDINPVKELIVEKLPFTEFIVLIVPKLVFRVPIYAEDVLIVVVDIPLLAVSRPPTPRVPVLLKLPLLERLVNDPLPPDTTTPVNPDPSPVNLPLKLPNPAVVENVDIYALILLIVVVDIPPCKVVKLAPLTMNVPLVTDVLPVIAAPPLKVANPATPRVPEFVMDTLFE